MSGGTNDRRRFLGQLLPLGSAACLACCATPSLLAEDRAEGPEVISANGQQLEFTPARWWESAGDGKVVCKLCPQECSVADRERGACGVRENRGGEYYTLVHSHPCSLHVDPVEKKPFYHFLPGTRSFSIAAPGCNIECKFCQNWQIAQVRPEQLRTAHLSPADVVALARREGARSIACTYTEPVVWSEYMQDIAEQSKKRRIPTLMVSNGYIQPGALADLLPLLGAVKIDLKAMTEGFYRETCRGHLEPVLTTLRTLGKSGVWTEIVVLLVPGLNDSPEEIRTLARFVRDEVGSAVPLHFTRFHPAYRLKNLPRTPIATLERSRELALAEGLEFVYVGNVPGHPGNHTSCPGCGEVLVRRMGFSVQQVRIENGRCSACSREIPGVWG